MPKPKLGHPVQLMFERGEDGKVFDDKGKAYAFLFTGNYKHPAYGKFSQTPDYLRAIKKNFDSGSWGSKIFMYYGHWVADRKAAGEITGVELADNDNTLKFTCEWTPAARKAIEEKEYNYVSAELDDEFEDPQGRLYGPVLKGIALTNQPFMRGGAQLAFSAPITEEDDAVTLEEMQAALKALQTKQADTDRLLSETKTALDSANAKVKELEAKGTAERSEADAKAARSKEFDAMVLAGKAVEAQREAYIAVDMKAFAEKAVALPTEPKADPATGDKPGSKVFSDIGSKDRPTEYVLGAEQEIDAKANALMAVNKNFSYAKAVSHVLAQPENKKLADAYHAKASL